VVENKNKSKISILSHLKDLARWLPANWIFSAALIRFFLFADNI